MNDDVWTYPEEADLSQADLADAVGMSRQTIRSNGNGTAHRWNWRLGLLSTPTVGSRTCSVR